MLRAVVLLVLAVVAATLHVASKQDPMALLAPFFAEAEKESVPEKKKYKNVALKTFQRQPGEKDNTAYGPVATPEVVDFLVKIPPPPHIKGCNNSHDQDKSKPLQQFLKDKGIVDGHCYFDFYTSCSMAVQSRNYVSYAVALASSALAVEDRKSFPNGHFPDGYHARNYHDLSDVYHYDALLCYENGFLDLPDRSWEDFDDLTRKAANKCDDLRKEVPDHVNESHGNMGFRVKLENQLMQKEGQDPYQNRKTTLPTEYGLKRHEAWKCDLWDPYSLACDMAYCRYNYCILPDGRVGQGLQCRKDWMEESFVRKNWEKSFSDAAQGATIPPRQ